MADDIKLVVGVDYSDLTGLVKTSEQTKRVLSSAAKDFAKTGSQKQYMHSVNKIVLAQKKLDVSSRMTRSEIMKLGAKMQQEVKFTDALTASTKRLTGAQGTSAKVMQQTKSRMNGNNMAIQQLGYQFGDFAVQVQGGTSAFVAFSQQGSQLAGILPMIAGPLGLSMGAAVGLSAALGILIPIGSAVGRMFFEMSDGAEKAKESADSLANRMESLTQGLYDYAAAKQAAERGMTLDQILANTALGNVDQRKRDIADLRKEIEGLQSSIAASPKPAAVIEIKPEYANIGPKPRSPSSPTDRVAPSNIEATAARVELRAKEEALAEKIRELELATLPIKLLQQQAQEKAVLLQRDYVRDAENKAALDQTEVQYGSESAELAKLRLELSVQSYARKVAELDVNEKLKLSLIEQYRASKEYEAWSLANQETMNILHEQTEMFLAGEAEAQEAARAEAEKYLATVTDLEAKIGEAGVDALLLAGVDIESGIDAAAIAAGKLAGKLSISLQEALNLIKLSNDPLSAFGGAGEFRPTYYPEDKKKTTGGGGANKRGGGANKRESQLEQFISSLMTERETLEKWRTEQIDLLGQYNETELEVLGGQAEAKLRIEKEYQDKRLALIGQSTNRERDMVFDSGIAILQSIGQFSDKALKVARVASAAKALINTYEGASEALKLPFPANLVAASSVIAAGMGFVSSIKSGGSSGGGSGAAATVPAQAAAATPQRVIIEGIDRKSLFSGEQLSNIFEAIYEENKNRGMVFEVAR